MFLEKIWDPMNTSIPCPKKKKKKSPFRANKTEIKFAEAPTATYCFFSWLFVEFDPKKAFTT